MNHTPLGQRIQKNSNGETTYFNYDEQGKLIGEYDKDNNPIREYIYLGNMPVGLFSNEQENQILQIHTDHLQTPRAVTNKNGEVLWKWESEAFGNSSPSIAEITMPLRFAGQYADDEVGLFYNYYRFYDPASGRYVENDPIGLEGGLNTYGYVGGSPLQFVDYLGLYPAQGAYGRGERGASGGLGGKNSNRPYKHCREFKPPQRKFVQCKDHQSGQWKRKPRPPEMPFPEDDNSSQMCGEECTEKAVVVAGGIAGGYVIYRCGRMIPSLAPPLWWTIPANAVTP